ncbi:GNAT family N-acetyltransferase [Vaginella massiliensis]|uniref:GNAT family N-acetyltransferase n=1 Tax=Vaginella massiliensis TaxID=1816680 RepID=UPI0008380C32|nr:GNAT family N-acetyltransferase [Vaginella massiliensis]
METSIKLELEENQGAFYLFLDEQKIGELTFSLKDNYMIISHTGVDVEHRGQGLAEKLVNEAITYARENQLKIRPYCSYVSAYMMRKPELKDLL